MPEPADVMSKSGLSCATMLQQNVIRKMNTVKKRFLYFISLNFCCYLISLINIPGKNLLPFIFLKDVKPNFAFGAPSSSAIYRLSHILDSIGCIIPTDLYSIFPFSFSLDCNL